MKSPSPVRTTPWTSLVSIIKVTTPSMVLLHPCCDRVTCLIITIEISTLLCYTNQCFCRVGLRSGSSVQSVLSDYQPPSTTADFSGKELLAPKTHRRSGGGEGLPALPTRQIHFQHQESGEQWLNGERLF